AVAVGPCLYLPVGRLDHVAPAPLRPEVGLVRPEPARRIQRGVSELPQRQPGELGVNPSVVITHACEPISPPPAAPSGYPRHAAPPAIWRLATRIRPDRPRRPPPE